MMPENLPQDRGLDQAWLSATVAAALDEDLGGRPGRDVTTQATISSSVRVKGDVVVRGDGVLAGIDVVAEVLSQVARRLGLDEPTVELLAADGDRVAAGTAVARIEGAGH
ncbi:MAG: nicotinate-nucleotide diphosphorylase (carboxylating), partial [Actinobacteria bacterium HGW-Actinobacteria-8]